MNDDFMSETITAAETLMIETQESLLEAVESAVDIEILPPRIQKIMMDYVLTIMIIVPALPFLMIIAVLIKIDSRGPVFFRQPRIGLNNKTFRIWKFRTMRHDVADIGGARLTARNDSRITPFGAWLRKWSIDELPQLINVLTGEMSLVGPRPHALCAKAGDRLYYHVVPNYAHRHVVKPGITGWAQVNGWRGETNTAHQIEQRVLYDMEYIRRQSLTFDLWIILLTAKREIWSKKAF